MPLTSSRCAPIEDMIHGVLVLDPYRWLEDRDLAETEEWIQKQRQSCNAYFAECRALSAIRERVREHLDMDIVDQPARIGDRYFYRRRARAQEQGCIYVLDAITGAERLLVDPTPEGSFVSVGVHRISPDGSLLAYERKIGGEDKKSIHIVDVSSGAALTGGVERGHARGFVFSPDSRGFYFCQEISAPSAEHTVRFRDFYPSETDEVVFSVKRSCESRLVLVSDSIHLGVIWIREVEGEMVQNFWIACLKNRNHWHRVFSEKPLSFKPILKGGRIFAISHENTENGKLVELTEDGQEIRTIIHEQKSKFRQLLITEDKIFFLFQYGLESSIRSWSQLGEELSRIDLPSDGTLGLISELGDGSSIFVSYQSFIQPPKIFEYVPSSGLLTVWQERPACKTLKSAQVWRAAYASVDGTDIPITLMGQDLPSEGKAPVPVIMTSYGGFGVPMMPQFSVLATLLMGCGVLLVVPHIRGGGEFGADWHNSATGRNRQVAFDDFLAAGQWLCNAGITTPSKLAIIGGSNSGLLVGVAMTQRPDLFRAVLCIAPLLDMVRYECFGDARKWRNEYGSCKSKEEFKALYSYSPYHRITDSSHYPAVLFVTGDKDDRCDPAHVRKMVARLLESDIRSTPVLIDYNLERGHSPVLPLNVRIEALALRVAFLCRELNVQIASGELYEAACS
jgi:prolyl oligopeptidase